MSHIDEGRLAAYLDGELPAGSGEMVEIELHVEACTECRKLLEESLRHRNRARAILRSGLPSTEAPSFDEILHRAGKSGASPGVARERSRLASLAWAATLVLAIGTGWYLTRDRMNGPVASLVRSGGSSPRTQPETAVVLAEKNEAETPADARREEPLTSNAPVPAPAAPTPEPQAGARADQPGRVAAGAPANQAPPVATLAEKAKQPDTIPPAKLAAPPVVAGQTLAAGATRNASDSGRTDRLAKTSASLDESAAIAQAAAEKKRAESVIALKDTPSRARGRAALAPSAAAAPAAAPLAPPPPWRETSQGGAMRQLGRLPVQVPDLPVLGYYVRPSGAPEIRVTHDLGQGQVLEVIQRRMTADSAAVPEARNELAGFAGNEVTEEAEGYRTTVRGPLSRDSLTALSRKLR